MNVKSSSRISDKSIGHGYVEPLGRRDVKSRPLLGLKLLGRVKAYSLGCILVRSCDPDESLGEQNFRTKVVEVISRGS